MSIGPDRPATYSLAGVNVELGLLGQGKALDGIALRDLLKVILAQPSPAPPPRPVWRLPGRLRSGVSS